MRYLPKYLILPLLGMIVFFCCKGTTEQESGETFLLTQGIWVFDTTGTGAVESNKTRFYHEFKINGTGSTRKYECEVINIWTWKLEEENTKIRFYIQKYDEEFLYNIKSITSSELIIIPLLGDLEQPVQCFKNYSKNYFCQ